MTRHACTNFPFLVALTFVHTTHTLTTQHVHSSICIHPLFFIPLPPAQRPNCMFDHTPSVLPPFTVTAPSIPITFCTRFHHFRRFSTQTGRFRARFPRRPPRLSSAASLNLPLSPPGQSSPFARHSGAASRNLPQDPVDLPRSSSSLGWRASSTSSTTHHRVVIALAVSARLRVHPHRTPRVSPTPRRSHIDQRKLVPSSLGILTISVIHSTRDHLP